MTLKLGFLGRKWFHLSDSRTIVSSKRDQGTDYTLQDESCCIWLNNSKRILKKIKKKNVIKHITFEILFNHEFPKTAAMIIHCTRIKTMKETHIKRLRLLMKWTNIKRVTKRLLQFDYKENLNFLYIKTITVYILNFILVFFNKNLN